MIYYGIVTFLIFIHLIAIYGIYLLFFSEHTLRLIFEIIFLWHIFGFGVTAGLHRLWSHRSYKAKPLFRFILWLLVCGANQGTIIHWVRDHRVHHKYSDTDADPHNINNGFFFAHMGWLIQPKNPQVTEKGKDLPLDDLYNDFIVRLDKLTHPFSHILVCFVLPTLYGYYQYNDAIIGFIVLGVLRWMLVMHSTWCINSVAHSFGYKPYSNIKPVQNLFTSIFAVGEGWHNYHHTYPYDYSTAENFIEYNPTKLFIDCFALFGQVYDRKRANIEIVNKNKNLYELR